MSVEYILTAEFDIDAGPVLRHQYPEPIVGDKALLAELMLPDQSHARVQDWTIFFLYREDDEVISRDMDASSTQLEERRKAFHYSLAEKHGVPQQFYVLNLVNTKFDESVRRGAVVKSMCIVTKYPFFQIFKPLLVLALHKYLDNSDNEHLKSLFDTINTLDLSKIPKLSFHEKRLLCCSDNPGLFAERFSSGSNGLSDQMSYLDIKSHKGSGTMRLSSLDIRHRMIRDTHFYDTNVSFENMAIPIKIPTNSLPETVGDSSILKLVSLLISSSQSFTDRYHPHLTIYGPSTPPLLVLIFGLLTQKRILFVGMNSFSQDVSEHVLAACSLVSGGILRSFLKRTFPYTDLSKVEDLLTTPGYIAGVKNPTFEFHPDWWDILVDLETGEIKISKEISVSLPTDFSDYNVISEDMTFIEDLKKMVINHYGDTGIRSRCWTYICRFVRIACSYEEAKLGATNLWPSADDTEYSSHGEHGGSWSSNSSRQRDLHSYGPVIEGWRASASYKCYIKDQRTHGWCKLPKSVVDYDYLLEKLRCSQLTQDESADVYKTLCGQTNDHEDIVRLLLAGQMSPSPSIYNGPGGAKQTNDLVGNAMASDPLFLISLGLFHRNNEIRSMTSQLLQRIEVDNAGRLFITSLNPFSYLTYRRILSERAKEPFVPQTGVPF